MLDDVGSISREDWERALALYPRLSTTLLPRDNSPAARQDITLYKLMQVSRRGFIALMLNVSHEKIV